MTSNSNLSNMRRLVEQLKLEASVERIKVNNINTKRDHIFKERKCLGFTNVLFLICSIYIYRI